MKDANQDNRLNQKEITIEEYARTKDSVNRLLNIMDLEGTEYEERLRIVNAILALMNDGKNDSIIRKSLIEDVVHSGVLRHYFSETSKEIAEKILNQTIIQTEAEAVIYKLNFLIPDNEKFLQIYQQNNGSLDKINAIYRIPESKILVMKAMECQKYLDAYNKYKRDAQVTKSSLSPQKKAVRTETPSRVEEDYNDGLNKLEDIMNRFKEQRKALEQTEILDTKLPLINERETEFEFPEMPTFVLPETFELEETKEPTPVIEKEPIISIVPSKITIPKPQLEPKKDNIGELTEITDRIRILSNNSRSKDKMVEDLKREVQDKDIQITHLRGDKADLSERYKASLNVIATLKQDNEGLVETNQRLIEFIKQISEELGMTQDPLGQEYDYKKVA